MKALYESKKTKMDRLSVGTQTRQGGASLLALVYERQLNKQSCHSGPNCPFCKFTLK